MSTSLNKVTRIFAKLQGKASLEAMLAQLRPKNQEVGPRQPKNKYTHEVYAERKAFLEKNSETGIPTLTEANDKIDDGDIYLTDVLELNGGELIKEIRRKLSIKLESLIFDFLNNKNLKSYKQECETTIYLMRNHNDSCLDFQKSISEQFNLLRVCDNDKYPAFFFHNNKKYILKIYEE